MEYVNDGNSRSGDGEDGDRDFNFILATANTIIPAVATNDPYVRVRPRRAEDVEQCKEGEATINAIFPKMHAADIGQAVLLDEELFGIGICAVEIPTLTAVASPTYETGPTQESIRAELADAAGPPVEPGAPVEVVAAVEEILLDYIPLEEPVEDEQDDADNIPLPILRRVPPDALLVPDGYDHLGRMPWVVHKRAVLLDELRSEQAFDGATKYRVPKGAAPNCTMRVSQMGMAVRTDDKADAVTIYEVRYWTSMSDGTKTRRLMLLLDAGGVGHDATSVIYHVDDPSHVTGYPYVICRTALQPGEFYPSAVAPIGSIRPIAAELNRVLQDVLAVYDQASRQKILVAPGALQGNSKIPELIRSRGRLAMAEMSANVSDIRAAFQLIPIPSLPGDTSFIINTLQRFMYEISGVDAYQRGGVGRKGTTATEVAAAVRGASGRAEFRARKYEQFLAEVAAKTLQLCKQFWTGDVLIRINGAPDGQAFRKVSAESLPDTFDIVVDSGSTAPANPAVDQQALGGLIGVLDALAKGMQPLEQAGTLAPGTVARLVERAFDIFNENHRLLAGPLGDIAAMIGNSGPGGGAQPMPLDPAAAQPIEADAPMPTNTTLAGTGPRPRPGMTAGGI